MRYSNCARCFPKDNPIKESITGSIAEVAVRDIADASVIEPNGSLAVGLKSHFMKSYKCTIQMSQC